MGRSQWPSSCENSPPSSCGGNPSVSRHLVVEVAPRFLKMAFTRASWSGTPGVVGLLSLTGAERPSSLHRVLVGPLSFASVSRVWPHSMMITATSGQTSTGPGHSLLSHSLCFQLHCGAFGGYRVATRPSDILGSHLPKRLMDSRCFPNRSSRESN